ncbi:hypothetical protein WS96_31195 [Burkholderia sp. MSMB1835]|nr:hypothetical protein WS96_31195 [Burkholderia sp. MSMB1835]
MQVLSPQRLLPLSFDNETFYTNVLADDATAFRFDELSLKRKPADVVMMAVRFGERQDGGLRGRIRCCLYQARGEGLCPLAGDYSQRRGAGVEETRQDYFLRYFHFKIMSDI